MQGLIAGVQHTPHLHLDFDNGRLVIIMQRPLVTHGFLDDDLSDEEYRVRAEFSDDDADDDVHHMVASFTATM